MSIRLQNVYICFAQHVLIHQVSYKNFFKFSIKIIENKGNSSKFLKQICLFCDLPNASYRKINKSQNFGEAISKINTLRILSQLQEKQLKSMVKLSNKYVSFKYINYFLPTFTG